MSLWGMSWFEAIVVTLGILGWQVLSCLLIERILAPHASGELDASRAEDANLGDDERRRAA